MSIKDCLARKGVSLTFDDCFSSVYYLVYPFLKEFNIPFTLFVTVEYIDKSPYLTAQQLKTLSSDPLCTIGAHTLTHTKLRSSKNSNDEIAGCKSALEKRINKPVDLFAYPYGSIAMCSIKNLSEARSSGFKWAFSTVRGSTDSLLRMKYFLPRVNGDHLVRDYKENEK